MPPVLKAANDRRGTRAARASVEAERAERAARSARQLDVVVTQALRQAIVAENAHCEAVERERALVHVVYQRDIRRA